MVEGQRKMERLGEYPDPGQLEWEQDVYESKKKENTKYETNYLVKTGMNQQVLLSPKISWKLLYLPRLKPSLSSPVLKIGALKASENKQNKFQYK